VVPAAVPAARVVVAPASARADRAAVVAVATVVAAAVVRMRRLRPQVVVCAGVEGMAPAAVAVAPVVAVYAQMVVPFASITNVVMTGVAPAAQV
jgi:hypothetical protein